MGRKRKAVKVDESGLHLPPCRVCGGPAGGLHYGVNTCEACKGFFHRNSNSHHHFKCEFDGNCSISYTIAKFCKKCRFSKCIAVGMAKDAIKTGRYTIEKRTKDILEVKSLQTKEPHREKTCDSDTRSSYDSDSLISNSLIGKSPIKNKDSDLSSSSEGQQLKPAFQKQTDIDKSYQLTFCVPSPSTKSNDSTLSQKSLPFNLSSPAEHSFPNATEYASAPSTCLLVTGMQSPSSTASDSNCLQDCSNGPPTSACQRCSCAKDIREMYRDKDHVIDILVKAKYENIEKHTPNLTKEELRKLAAEHIEECRLRREMFGSMHRLSDQEYDYIYASTGLDADGRQRSFDGWNRGQELYIRALVKFAKCIPGFSLLDIQDQFTLIKYSRAEFMLITGFGRVDSKQGVILCIDKQFRCKHDASGVKCLEDHFERYFEQSDHLERLELTPEEVTILSAIAVMAPDRDHNIESEKVTVIYEQLVDCLIHSFSKHHERPLQKFAKVISIILECRTFCHKSIEVIKSFRLEKYSNIKHSPLLCDMFGGIYFDDVESEENEDTKSKH